MTAEAHHRRVYRKPPIQEALCELHFEAGDGGWDATVPGRFAQELPERYSGPVKDRTQMEATFEHADHHLDATVEMTPRTSFQTDDGFRLAVVGPNRCSAHALSPYPGWEQFRSDIEAVLGAYGRAAAPRGVRRVGLRYVNRVVVPSADVDLSRYFRVLPVHPPGIAKPFNEVLVRLRIAYEADVTLLLTMASVADEAPDSSAFLLDLDLIWQPQDGLAIPLSEAVSRVDRLHDEEGKAFEACITDDAREVFDA